MSKPISRDHSITDEEIAAHDDQRDMGDSGWSSLRTLYAEQFQGVVLDAGGGTGIYASALEASGLDVVLADMDESMLAAARHRGLASRRIVQADVTALPFADASFGGVHVAHVLHVVAGWRRAVDEFARVTRPRGSVLLALGGSDHLGTELGEIVEYINNEIGAETITPGQAAGLKSPDDADQTFTLAGLNLSAVNRIEGAQRRSFTQLIDRMLLNPYRSTAGREARANAAAQTKTWASKRFGSLERVVEVPTSIEYRIYHKTPT